MASRENVPGGPREGQGEGILAEEEEISPTERRYRERRDLRIDQLLRRVHRHGIESLAEAELSFLERSAAELRRELGWEQDPVQGACWDPPEEDPAGFTPP